MACARSTVLLGQRRMGKTEIFKRVVNRLFFEQDHLDPQAVVPVYYSFPDTFENRWDFATKYVENFIRWYVAFRLRSPKILSEKEVKRSHLKEIIHNKLPMTKGFKNAFEFLESILAQEVTIPEQSALSHPRYVSDYEDSTIVMFLDEFQNTRLPQYKFDVVGYMQEAVESLTCPHFVTGSTMSILGREILGRGSLFGRFRSKPIEALTDYWGTELVCRAAHHNNVTVSQEIVPVIVKRCGGNPFYLNAVVEQAAELNQAILTEDDLNTILAIDLSSGFIWGELNDQISRWLERINEYGITKWVLYLSAIQKGDKIDLKQIQQALLEKDFQTVSLEKIREVLIKLSRGDLVDYLELGGWFRKVKDPILLEFLQVWGRIEVEGQDEATVREDFEYKYKKIKKQVSDLKGYLAEVYMAQILHNAQRQTLPGHYFHQDEDVKVPRFHYVRLRERLGPGAETEIDIHAGAGSEQWVAESKWQQNHKASITDIRKLLDKAEVVKQDREAELMRIWFFSYEGFAPKVLDFMSEHGVLWSTQEDLDGLLDYVKLRRLPKL
ncbi:ATPase domain protein, prokaryote domain protein [Candidatus Thiomargarita nelsonii]|uniref:ATPase domain protein, prokaryote domain protein n=1 Tax=Candidatus Thiomargarita nelsonii TaxID=1003181 RepID=A0A176RTY6_9GAMM|nr:ATPase domain protein, prokaryote domain protein [Candidatus Thiomargarita nelsonii]